MDERSRLSDVKVGLFVLGALLILIVGSLWIVGSSYFVGERVPYRVLLKDSKGVEAGDRVRFAGVSVGRIQGVTLRPEEPWPVILQVALKPEIPVREDSSAAIASSGLMGTSFLQILPGTAESPLLRPGGTIHGRRAGGLEGTLVQVEQISERVLGILDQASGLIDQVAGELGPLMGQLTRLLSEENVEEFGAILAGVRGAVDEVAPRVGPLLDRLDSLTRQLEAGTGELPELMTKVSVLLDDLDAALGSDGARLAGVLETAQRSLGSADDALAVIRDNRGEIETTLHDLQLTVANLKAFSQQIKQRPSSLIRTPPEPERRPGQGAKGGGR
jgi:phospholipid/cholesterol/gamma-HCH transport system substrate-binding protein